VGAGADAGGAGGAPPGSAQPGSGAGAGAGAGAAGALDEVPVKGDSESTVKQLAHAVAAVKQFLAHARR
jgi:hypothetical protein